MRIEDILVMIALVFAGVCIGMVIKRILKRMFARAVFLFLFPFTFTSSNCYYSYLPLITLIMTTSQSSKNGIKI